MVDEKSFRDEGSGLLVVGAGRNGMAAWQGWDLEYGERGERTDEWLIDEELEIGSLRINRLLTSFRCVAVLPRR